LKKCFEENKGKENLINISKKNKKIFMENGHFYYLIFGNFAFLKQKQRINHKKAKKKKTFYL